MVAKHPYPSRPDSHLVVEVLAADHLRRERGFDTGWRSLPGGLLESPRQGAWELGVRDARGGIIRHHCGPGEVMAIPAHTPHFLRVPSGPGFITDFLLAHFNWVSGHDLLGMARLPIILRGPEALRLTRTLARIPPMASGQATVRFTELASRQEMVFRALALALSFAEVNESRPPQTGLDRIAPALKFLRESREANPSVAQLAQGCGLSTSRFHVLFKETLGMGPKRYVEKLRLLEASRRLLHTAESVESIAQACHYGNSSHFIRRFYSWTGQTPGKFRSGFSRSGGTSEDFSK